MTTTTLPTDTTLKAVADALDVLSMSYVTEATSDWTTLARLVANGGAQNVLSIGDLIEESWVDTADGNKEYSFPWGVRHFGTVELEDGSTTNGMYLESQYVHNKWVQFSHQRAFLKCPDGLSAGTYYFTIENSQGSNVKAGDVVCFTLTQDVPAGGRIAGCYYAPDYPKDNWRIYSYSDAFTILETVTPTFEAAGTDLGIQKMYSRNGNLNSCEEMAYGWNRWSTSAVRQYLNSSAEAGKWWQPQDGWDIKPDQLDQIPGFLSGLPQELIDAMLPVKTRTYLCSANDTTEYGVDYDDTYDKVFLASINQIYAYTTRRDEGEPWDYWKMVAGTKGVYPTYVEYPELVRFAMDNRAKACPSLFRSANILHEYITWIVNYKGFVGNVVASASYTTSPCCVIGKV